MYKLITVSLLIGGAIYVLTDYVDFQTAEKIGKVKGVTVFARSGICVFEK